MSLEIIEKDTDYIILKTTEKENSAKMSIKNEIKNLHRKNNKNS